MAEADNVVSSNDLMKFLEDGGVKQLLVKDDGAIVKKDLKDCDFLNGVVGVYFSAHWCPPCKGYTPELAKKYSELKDAGLTVVFCSWDKDIKSFDDYFGEMPWAAIPFEYKEALQKSKSFKQPSGIPSLYLFNKKGNLYQTSGRDAVMDGRPFPYENPTLAECLEIVIDGEGNPVDVAALKAKKHLALYFSGHWCGPCRGFTPKLADTYKKMIARDGDDRDYEFIFVSSDRDVPAFQSYFGEMPWLAFNKESEKFDQVKKTLNDMFGVSGIPALGVMTPDGDIVQKNARGAVGDDPEGAKFPWPSEAFYDLSSGNLDGINNAPTIILMMDKSTEDKDSHTEFLKPHATAQLAMKSARECFHFTGKVGDNITTQIRKISALGDSDHMLLLDIPEKKCAVADLPTKAEDVSQFFQDYKDGKLTTKALNL